MEPIKVLLVSNQEIRREGLQHILQRYEEIQVVGEATSGEEAIQPSTIPFPECCPYGY